MASWFQRIADEHATDRKDTEDHEVFYGGSPAVKDESDGPSLP